MSIISLQKDKLHVCACETPILSGLVLEVEICICCSCLVLSVHQIELVIYAYNGLGLLGMMVESIASRLVVMVVSMV